MTPGSSTTLGLFASLAPEGRPLSERPYVPLLLDRGGERAALDEYPYSGAPDVGALLQVTPPGLRDGAEQGQAPATWVAALARKVGLAPVYLDVAGARRRTRADARLAASAVADVLGAASDKGIRFAPVYPVGVPSVAPAVVAAAADQRLGAAIRVAVDGIVVPTGRSLADVVDAEAERLGLAPADIDLVVDLGYLDANFDIDAASAGRVLDPLAALAPWRSVVLAGGSVPGTLSAAVEDGQIGGILRAEWRLWQEMRATRPWLRFGDYGVQNPVPPDPGHAPHMRASIRYTAGDHMLAARGEGPVLKMSREAKEAEYRDLARRVFEHPSFSHCCSGDQFIADCADGRFAVLAQQRWRGISTLHHLAVVARQVQAVVSPVSATEADAGARGVRRRTSERRDPVRVRP